MRCIKVGVKLRCKILIIFPVCTCQAGNWSIEAAVELYFQAAAHAPMTMPATPQTSQNALQQLYRLYQDAQSDMILAEGVEQLCHDLQVCRLLLGNTLHANALRSLDCAKTGRHLHSLSS